MPHMQYMPLHWGSISEVTVVENLEPMGRILPRVAGGATSKGVVAKGVVKKLGGSGRTKKLKGSGITKPLKGSGRIC